MQLNTSGGTFGTSGDSVSIQMSAEPGTTTTFATLGTAASLSSSKFIWSDMSDLNHKSDGTSSDFLHGYQVKDLGSPVTRVLYK